MERCNYLPMKLENAYKIKLLKILEILRQDSDEDNYIETGELLGKLSAMRIVCDRRTLAADIETLNNYGYEVLCEKSPGMPNRYCVADRSFSVSELRILMDAVQASCFVTPKKTEELVDKIAELGGSHRAELLRSNRMLKVAKGDVFEFGLSFENVTTELIEKVVFACKELGIEEEADREEDEFRIRIPGEVTKDFKTGFLKYDIIATLIDEQEVTLVHRQKLEVLERVENGG